MARNNLARLRGGFGKFGGRLAMIVIGLGLAVVGLGWNGAASDPRVSAQMPFLISGVGLGLGLVITGAALMVVQAGREDRARLEDKFDQLAEALTRTGLAGPGTPGSAAPADLAGLVVAGSASYHVPGCRLVDGREEVTYLTPDEARARWLAPCRVCQPDSATVSS